MPTHSDHRTASPDVELLRRFDTCTLSNAIELLNLRPRTEGYVRDRGVSCMFPALPPVAGFAVTGRMRAASQPIHGHCYYDHLEWWNYVASVPAPRIVVLLDADDPPGAGALFGELHARICMALNCLAYVTNGAVRDLASIERLGFQLFAGSTSVSHAYAHVVDFGQEIELGGLKIRSGDLLHGDRNGLLSIPSNCAAKLPKVAAGVLESEHRFIRMCIDGNFSIDRLSEEIRRYTREHESK